jgi:hypothetical protein
MTRAARWGRALHRLWLPPLFCMVLAGAASAQYYDPREEVSAAEGRFAYGGAMWRDFSPRSTNTMPESTAFRFTKVMPVIGFRAGLIDFLFGYTTASSGNRSHTAIYFGATIAGEFVASGGRQGALLIQPMLAADFTKVGSGGAQRDDFNVATLGLGMGLEYRISSREVLFSAKAGILAHLAIEGYSTGNGFSPAVTAESTVCFRDVGPFDGVAVGYRFRLQTWSMNNAALDYRSVFHGPTLGVMF